MYKLDKLDKQILNILQEDGRASHVNIARQLGVGHTRVRDRVLRLEQAGVLYAPGKASNAGGVATSGLEMSQNAMRLSWPREEVDNRLHSIMVGIHEACLAHGRRADGSVSYVDGANIAGFVKVADAMIAQGLY